MRYGYARVSTKKQIKGHSLEDQVERLQQEGCELVIQEQFTGSTTKRPKFEALIEELSAGDMLVVTKLDRFARNVFEGIEIIKLLFAKDIKVHILNVGLLENTAMGNFFITTLLAVAELERAMIQERTLAGREIARTKNGYKEGRPRIPAERLELALELKQTHTYKEVERLTGISKSSIIRFKRMKHKIEFELPAEKPLALGNMTKEELNEELSKGITSLSKGKGISADKVDSLLNAEI